MHKIGQAYGLVWTPEGSNLVQIKTIVRKGTGKLAVEGDIGHEFLLSIEHAVSLCQSTNDYSLDKHNVVFFIPGPVEGSSAGLPLFISLHSAITKQPVNQRVAFTGALSLTGAILRVGGIEDKIKAARRANLDAIVMPLQNLPELPNFAKDVPWNDLFICPITRVAEALVIALPHKRTATKLSM